MISRIRARFGAVLALTALAALMALPASANPEAVNTAISSGVTDATSIVTTNIPLILGVTVLFVALRFGKRLLGMLR
jgi:hypothetical protein